MPELVWVTQGKTEHLATLLGTLGAEGQETVEVRWASTLDREFVPVDKVRQDDGRRRRRTGPVSYAESPSSSQPSEEGAPKLKKAKGKRGRSNMDAPPQTHQEIRGEGIPGVSQSLGERLNESGIAGGERKEEVYCVPDGPVAKKGGVASHEVTYAGFVIPRKPCRTQTKPWVQGIAAWMMPPSIRNEIDESHTAEPERAPNQDGVAEPAHFGGGLLPPANDELQTKQSTAEHTSGHRPSLTLEKKMATTASSYTKTAMELYTAFDSLVGAKSSISHSSFEAVEVAAPGTNVFNRPFPVAPNADEAENNEIRTSPTICSSKNLLGQVHAADVEDNDVKDQHHELPKDVGNNNDDSKKVVHPGWSSARAGDFFVMKSSPRDPHTINRSEQHDSVPPEVAVPVDSVVPARAGQSASVKAGNGENKQETIAIPAIVIPLQPHAREDPQNVDDPQLVVGGGAYAVEEVNGVRQLSIPLPVVLAPPDVLKEISNDENTQSSSKQDAGDSSDDDALCGVTKSVHLETGWVKQANVSEAETKWDSSATSVRNSGEKNAYYHQSQEICRVAPKTPKAIVDNPHFSDDDDDNDDDHVIVHSIQRCQNKFPSPSPRGFEQELSKQQRLFLAEVSGEAPADSPHPSRKDPKESRIRINKANWNKIEKLKQGRGSDDDSVPGLRADKQ